MEQLALIKARRLEKAENKRNDLAKQFPDLFTTQSLQQQKRQQYGRIGTSMKNLVDNVNDENKSNNACGSSDIATTKIPFSTIVKTNSTPAKQVPAKSSKKNSTGKKIKPMKEQPKVLTPPPNNLFKYAKKTRGFNDLKSRLQHRAELIEPVTATDADQKVEELLVAMLEEKEIDTKTYRRLSRESFSMDKLRRLSGAMPSPLPYAAAQEETRAAAETEMVVEEEEAAISGVDVLTALRNYIDIIGDEVKNAKPEPPTTLKQALAVGLALAVIKGRREEKDFIGYDICIYNNPTSTEFATINHRYSDFDLFHSALVAAVRNDCPMLLTLIPPLPKKQLFAKFANNWKDPAFLDERQRQLNEFLCALLSSSDCFGHEVQKILEDFLTTSDLPVIQGELCKSKPKRPFI